MKRMRNDHEHEHKEVAIDCDLNSFGDAHTFYNSALGRHKSESGKDRESEFVVHKVLRLELKPDLTQ